MPPCSPTVLLWSRFAEDVQDKGHPVPCASPSCVAQAVQW